MRPRAFRIGKHSTNTAPAPALSRFRGSRSVCGACPRQGEVVLPHYSHLASPQGPARASTPVSQSPLPSCLHIRENRPHLCPQRSSQGRPEFHRDPWAHCRLLPPFSQLSAPHHCCLRTGGLPASGTCMCFLTQLQRWELGLQLLWQNLKQLMDKRHSAGSHGECGSACLSPQLRGGSRRIRCSRVLSSVVNLRPA